MAVRNYGKPVLLEPFVHQVGGHSCVLKYDENTLCKPLNSREHNIYENMPTDMQEFVPQYRGVVKVTCEEDSDGFMTLVAHPILSNSATKVSTTAAPTSGSKKKERPRKVASPSSSPSSSGEGVQSDFDDDDDSNMSEMPKRAKKSFSKCLIRHNSAGKVEVMTGSSAGSSLTYDPKRDIKHMTKPDDNPWSVTYYKKQISIMMRSNKLASEFLVLENLTSKLRLPCVLDLKMGTRQHGDDATEFKIQQGMTKCAESTSLKLGFRICGMKVYQADTDKYICHNKYYGRQLTESGVQEALQSFLQNGLQMRSDLVEPILSRLQKLHSVLSCQNTFRFYSSSLLIMYDGAVNSEERRLLQDGPSSSYSPTSSSSIPQQQHLTNHADISLDDSMEPLQGLCDPTHKYEEQLECSVDDTDWPPCSSDSKTPNKSRLCDVRMIDFAHTTYQGFPGDRTIHKGPDSGYMLGLENIIRMFENLRSHHV